ncbi:DUF2058 family protein [Desulfobacula sp.]|jgi:hypothetical protein|uniref:DUF2058 family protein n=1 Tax=Desulfobacula sp. TaxID=2593537 RepID=UPI0039B8FF02
MGLSLQDQLLKSGIADKKQANKARQEKRIIQVILAKVNFGIMQVVTKVLA